MMPTREDAWNLLTVWVSAESLRRHCLAVEAAMRGYAEVYDGDPEAWGIAGLLHDFDYEKHPHLEQHPVEGVKVLREKGYSEDICEAIMGHGDHTGTPRRTDMAKCLHAVDELSGFVVALAHIRPGNFEGMTADSVERSLKKKGFAAAIDRGAIQRGIDELGVDRKEHFERVIVALRGAARELGF
ncbi:MAG: HDIG domain-containing protein [Candidatus Jorgensenbacteria bacterium]|nr:HDIG domain-containing protein [Candidatus Jorgensenbacteria bacterium]